MILTITCKFNFYVLHSVLAFNQYNHKVISTATDIYTVHGSCDLDGHWAIIVGASLLYSQNVM